MYAARRYLVLFLTIICLVWTSSDFAHGASPAGGNWLELDDDAYYAPDDSSLDVGDQGSEDITVEAWVFIRSFPDATSSSRHAIIVAKAGAYELSLFANRQFDPMDLSYRTMQGFTFAIFRGAGTGYGQNVVISPSRYLNRWVHLAGVFDNQADKVSLFIDGKGFEGDSSISLTANSNSRLAVGGPLSDSGAGKVSFDGRLDELRISDRARYKTDFTPREASFTPDANTRALYHFDERSAPFADASGNGNTLFKEGSTPEPPVPGASPAGGNWLELEEDDVYYAVDAPSLDVGNEESEDITVEAWVFIRSFPDVSQAVVGSRHTCIVAKSGAYNLNLWSAFGGERRGIIQAFGFNVSGSDDTSFQINAADGAKRGDGVFSTSEYLNRWVHIAGVFDSQADKLFMFVDGERFERDTSVHLIANSDSPLVVGSPCDLLSDSDENGTREVFFDGKLDELRISDKARYKADFTPRRSPFTPDANTRALYHFDERSAPFADASGNGNTLLAVGSVAEPPVVSNIPNVTFREDESDASIDLDDYVRDPDTPDREINWKYRGNTNVKVSINSVTHVVSFTAAKDWHGSETIVFTASDNDGLSDSDSVTVTVVPVNDPPELASIGDKQVSENMPLQFVIAATDVDTGDTLTYSAESIPSGASWDPQTGQFDWTPDYDVVTTAETSRVFHVTFKVTDSQGASDKETITITVSNTVEPKSPKLSLSKTSLDFGTVATEDSFSVNNSGGGTLSWELSKQANWLDVSPASGSLASGRSDNVSVTVSRSGLSPGVYNDNISVTSNGGNSNIRVSMEVPKRGDWYVHPNGSNSNSGHSWEDAKLTIGAAMDSAMPGDVIRVASGKYVELVSFKDGIILIGQGAERTTIEYEDSVVIHAAHVQSGEITGFTIVRKGEGENSCVWLQESSLTITHNIITGGTISGISVDEKSDPDVAKNEITNNRIGIIILNESSGRVAENFIHGNELAGISLSGALDPQITGNTIASNGMGMHITRQSRGRISQNIIKTNETAGMMVLEQSTVEIVHNTIVENKFSGLSVCDGASPDVRNNIIVKSDIYGIDAAGFGDYGAGTPKVSYNDVWGNKSDNYTGLSKPRTDISVDPLFVDLENGDYHLKPNSPCRGAADDGSDMGAYQSEALSKMVLSIDSIEIQPGLQASVSLSMSDAPEVAGADIVIEYDASLITVIAIEPTELASRLSASINTDTPGRINIAMAGVNVISGSGELFDIKLAVDADAQVGSEAALSFVDSLVYDKSADVIPVEFRDGLVKIIDIEGIKGDINKDGRVRSNDAILALNIATGSLEPTEYQKWAADMNGDGKVRSNDAILILREAAGFTAPARKIIVGTPVTLSIAEAHGTAGDRISVALRADNISALAGGDLRVVYDSDVLKAVEISTESDMLLATNLDDPGIIRIAFAQDKSIGEETLARIEFHVVKDATSVLSFADADLYSSDGLPLKCRCIGSVFSSWAVRPQRSALLQNFPNPFNPDTWLPYQLKEGSEITIQIFSASGNLIRGLNFGYKPAGLYISHDRAAYWDGKNEAGEQVASGVYFYTIQAGEFTATKKMILAK